MSCKNKIDKLVVVRSVFQFVPEYVGHVPCTMYYSL